MFAMLVALTIAIGISAFVIVNNDIDTVLDAYSARRSLTLLLNDILDQETGVRGYAATRQTVFLEPFHDGHARYPGDFGSAVAVAGARHFTIVLEDVRTVNNLYAIWTATVVTPLIVNPNRSDAGIIELHGKRLVDGVRASIAHATRAGDAAIAQAVAQTRVALVGSFLAIVFLTVVLGTAAIRSERKATRQEAALRGEVDARNIELERSNRSLEEFAYVASHDLQEPLRTVASFTQLLQRRYAGKLDSDADEFIGYAVDGAVRMQQLIADILEYSRLTTHGNPLAPVDLTQSFLRATNNLRVTIHERGARVDADPLPLVMGDAPQLMQLLQNLIGNGLKYNTNPEPRVHVSARRDGGRWVIAVADNGIGIAPEYYDRIFGIFQRLHTRSEYGGTGIGLALCKRIVERHNGRIWVDSVEGSGAVFSFSLAAADKG
jgi:signal transduction histidine kinase